MTKRATDITAAPASTFRSERLFAVNGQWFFATREAGDQGPFATRDNALAALAAYVDEAVALEELRASMSASRDAPAHLQRDLELDALISSSVVVDDITDSLDQLLGESVETVSGPSLDHAREDRPRFGLA